MKTKNKLKKPWLDQRGRELPTSALQEISKDWDLETWNRYGDSLERSPEGKSLKPSKFRKLLEKQTKNVFSVGNQIEIDNPKIQELKQALAYLSPKQRLVIEHIFYNGRTTEETARLMEVSKSAVLARKKEALTKLKGVLSGHVSAVATYEGSSNSNENSKTRFEELIEVMNEEISREENSRLDFDKGEF